MSRFSEIMDGIFRRGTRFFKGYGVSLNGFKLSHLPFADVTFLNAVDLLTDLNNDVTWTFGQGKESLASAFKQFYNAYAKYVHTRFFADGFVVIAHNYVGKDGARADVFRIARREEFTHNTERDYMVFSPTALAMDNGVELYVLMSQTYMLTGKSDKEMLHPYLLYLDNALNASNTITEKLGAVVVASPAGSQNTFGRLNKEEKAEIEEEINKEYGALAQQSQFLLLPKEMNMQVVSLASMDIKTNDRVRTAVLAIADRLKVPANQIGMIDANSSKSLSNGSELREGDFNKYQSFERLLEETFVKMARDLGLTPGKYEMIDGVQTPVYYGIYNKPKRDNGQEGV